MIHCPKCGREISETAKACPGCGEDFAERKRREAAANAIGAAIILALAALAGLIILLPGIIINGVRGRYANRKQNFLMASLSDWQTYAIALPITAAVFFVLSSFRHIEQKSSEDSTGSLTPGSSVIEKSENLPQTTLGERVSQDNSSDSGADSMRFYGQWIVKNINSTTEVTKLQNIGDRPLKAFRASVYWMDDFGQVDSKEPIEFTSDVLYIGNGERVTHHVIKKGEVIYLTKMAMLDRGTQRVVATASNQILEEVHGNKEALAVFAVDPKRLRFELDDAVSDDSETPSSASANIQSESQAEETPQVNNVQPSERLTLNDIGSWDLNRVQFAIDVIYARYGTEFPSQKVQSWANAQSWYKRISGRSPDIAEEYMTDDDRSNIETLAGRRNALRSSNQSLGQHSSEKIYEGKVLRPQ